MTRIGAVTMAILGLGCGRLGYKATQGAHDSGLSADALALRDSAPLDGARETDAGIAPPWRGTFRMSTPTAVASLNSDATERNCSVSPDGLELYFSSDRPGTVGGGDLYVSTWSIDRWGAPVHLTGLSSTRDDSRIHTVDGLSAWMSSSRAGTLGGSDIWSLTRTTRDEPWSMASAVNRGDLNSTAAEYDPWISTDQLRVYFASERSGGVGGADLYVAARSSPSATFDPPRPVGGVNSADYDGSPTLSPDELFLVFDRGVGNRDLYFARRSEISAPFVEVQPLDGVNTSVWDADPCLSPSGTLYFTSQRSGMGDIYQTEFIPI